MAGRGHVLALLSLIPALAGCETLERMDYLDRFFEPPRYAGPVSAVEPQPDPVPAPVTGPEPLAGPIRAMEPRPDPVPAPAPDWSAQQAPARTMEARPQAAPSPKPDADSSVRLLVRQHPWLMRFWAELTAAQQLRVERQLHRADVQLAAEPADPAAIWDTMGLADRARLVFGSGPPFERPTPGKNRDGSTWAGSP